MNLIFGNPRLIILTKLRINYSLVMLVLFWNSYIIRKVVSLYNFENYKKRFESQEKSLIKILCIFKLWKIILPKFKTLQVTLKY